MTAPVVGLMPGLVGCSDPTVNDGSIRGTASVFVATMHDGTQRMDYRLLVGGDENDERRLLFRSEPDFVTGDDIKVWGDVNGGDISVSRWERVSAESGGVGTSQDAIIDGTPYAARTFAYALVNIGGGNGTYTASAAQVDVFGTGASDASVKQWFLEASYGRQDLGGNVVTGLTFQMTGCNTTALANGLRTPVNTALGMTPQHYLWYLLTDNPSCDWSGLASVGSPQTPARDTWYNNSSSCVVLVQEPSHNLGMQHSSSLRCPNGASFANDPGTCTHDEYGDRHDPMGGGCRHTNAWQKAYQGWFGGCNSVRVMQSGTFTLLPLEVECNGIQVLQIPMPVTNRIIPRSGGGGSPSNDPVQYYYLELRTRTGFDQPQTSYPTILVHVGPDYRPRTQDGRHTWILDMVPSTTGTNSFDGMAQGQTFTDPAGGVSFRVDSLSASSASITVTVPTNSANTCAGGGNLTAPGPATCTSSGMGGMGGMGGMAGAGGRGGAGGGGTGGTAGRGGAGAGGMSGSAGRGGAGAGGAGAGGIAGSAGAGGAGAGGAGPGGADPGGMSGGGGLGGMSGVGGDTSAGAAGIAGGGAGGDSSAGAAGIAGAGGLLVAGSGGMGVAGSAQAGAGVTAGAATAGAAGAGTAGGGPGPGPGGGDDPQAVGDDSGCGCRIEKAQPRRDASMVLSVLGLVAGGVLRRRRRAA
jgi:hypothetical protein